MIARPPASSTELWRSCHAALIDSCSLSDTSPAAANSASRLPPSTMSVPRPAILVAIVTLPGIPAWATISASFSWNLAFNTECLILRFFSSFDKCSDDSMETVPTKTGWPRSTQSTMSLIMASIFSGIVKKIRSA